MEEISFEHFQKFDIRVGEILEAEPFEGLRKPAIKLLIDFGDAGIKKSSAQITDLYKADQLAGKKVLAIINFPAKQIKDFMSACLVLGAVDENGVVTLLETAAEISNGSIVR